MHVGPPRGDDRKNLPDTGSEFAASESSQSSIGVESLGHGIWARFRQAAVRLLEQILFEPQSRAQRDQLARKILDYSRMHRRDSEPFVIEVPKLADLFHEPRRHVRQSLELLEENGTVERTQSKDHWTLTIRVQPPIRATYQAPQVSAPFPKMPLNPPPGWIELQNRAHKAKDAQEFNEIIGEMNRLLLAQEKAPGDEHAPGGSPIREADRKSASSSGQD